MFFSSVAFLISATCSLNPFFAVKVFPVIDLLATFRISFICFFWFVAAFCLGAFPRASLGVRLAAFPLSAFSLSIFRRFNTRSRADVIPRRSISATEMPDSLERHKTSVSLFVGSVITTTFIYSRNAPGRFCRSLQKFRKSKKLLTDLRDWGRDLIKAIPLKKSPPGYYGGECDCIFITVLFYIGFCILLSAGL